MLINKLKRRFVAFVAPKAPLKRELFYLKRAIIKWERILDDMYSSAPPGVCCPYCWRPELRDLEEKQDRRIERFGQLRNKLNGASTTK